MASDLESQGLAAGAAFFGVLARARGWRKADGSFDRWTALSEIVAAPCLGLIAYGLGSYWGLNDALTSMLAAMFGLLGTSAVSEIVKTILDRFVGKGGNNGRS